MSNVLRDAVGQVTFEVCPNKFIRIEFRGVSREVDSMDASTALKELLDGLGPVERASVPKKNDGSSKVARKMPKESTDLFSPDVFVGVKTDVEPKTLSSRRAAERRNRGDFRPVTGHSKNRSLAPDAPGLSDGWDKREAALVEKDDWKLKLPGVFLYAAKGTVSNVVPLLGLSPWLAFPASDNSSPFPAGLSRRGLDDSGLRNASGSPGLFWVESKARFGSRSSWRPSKEVLPVTSSGARLVSGAVRESAWIPTHPILLSFASRSNGVRRLSNNQAFLPRLPAVFLDPRVGWLAAAASPVLFGFHGVSLGQCIIGTLFLRESIMSAGKALSEQRV